MRTTLTILLIILPSTLLQLAAQYANNISILHYRNSSGEHGRTTYIYNNRQTPYKAVWELEDGSRWSVNTHEFDANQNMVRKYREFSDSITLLQTFAYNAMNQLTKETFARSDGVNGHVTYTYQGGRCLHADCEGLNGWFNGRISYHYNEKGLRSGALLEQNGEVIGKIIYRYDKKGRLSEETWNFNSGFSQVLVYVYRDNECIPYRSSNIFIQPGCRWLVDLETYDYCGKMGGPSIYEYRDGNKLVKKTFTRQDGLQTVTGYFYQPDGRLDSSLRYYNDGKQGLFTYQYNEYGQLVERRFTGSDGFTASEEYMYDPEGKLVSAIYEGFDGWLTGTLLFSHDRYDRITAAAFKNKEGPDALLTFTNNADGLPEQIRWEFTDGTTQTYLFRYREAGGTIRKTVSASE